MERNLCAGALVAISAILLTGGCDVRIYPFRSAMTDAGPLHTDGPPAHTDAPPTDGSADGSLPIPCPDELVGYAATGSGTVGGGSAAPLVVNASDPDAFTQFSTYANEKMPGPLVIQVNGMIAFPGPADGGSSVSPVRISSDKTIIGSGANSGFTGGGLSLTGSSDVIIKNLVISNPNPADSDTDAIHLEKSKNIWIDHCDLSSDRGADAGTFDGLVDITHASDLVTISWTRYHDHNDTGIIGHSDTNAAEDDGFLHVTYHHDLFTHVVAGPRVRFGSVHIFNVYFEEMSGYAVASTMYALVLVDDTYFKNIPAPAWPLTTTLPNDSTFDGYFWLSNNITDATDGPDNLTTLAMQWTPPYAYTPDSVGSVPALVAACAGTGKTPPPP